MRADVVKRIERLEASQSPLGGLRIVRQILNPDGSFDPRRASVGDEFIVRAQAETLEAFQERALAELPETRRIILE